jgi:hypothetical protein
MTLVGFVACGVIEDSHLQKGNPMRLTNAIDYTGHICGYNGDVKNKPYGYYLLDKTGSSIVVHCPIKIKIVFILSCLCRWLSKG